MSVRLLGGHKAFPVVGAGGLHRSGWPLALGELQPYHSEDAACGLDDYVDTTFTWCRHRLDHHPSDHGDRPWVMIAHHPVTVKGDVWSERTETIEDTLGDKDFQTCRRSLVGGVSMCPVLARHLESRLKVPVLTLSHPTALHVLKWDPVSFTRNLWQVGHYLRDSRVVFRLPAVVHWTYSRMRPRNRWCVEQDKLQTALHAGQELRDVVEETPHLSPADYDARMGSCVMLTWTMGAAANNIVVECAARHAPLIVNRSESVEWYLGKEYPLFVDDVSEIPPILEDPTRIMTAHEYLAAREWWPRLDANGFAGKVNAFCEWLTEPRKCGVSSIKLPE